MSIVDFAFTPPVVTMPIGSTIRWTNNGQVVHTSTSTQGVWDSGQLFPGDTFSFTFTSAGSYPYVCTIHPQMTGTIVVTGACPTSTPLPTPTVVCPPTGTAEVTIGSFYFNPDRITVAVGSTVRWTNTEAFHSTVSETGLWDSGPLEAGQSFTYTFTLPGTYPYRCGLHPKLHSGVVYVSGSCSTSTATRTNTSLPTSTSTNTAVPPTITPTVCTITFTDVPPTDPFYNPIRCLWCRGIISGYADNTFRTYNDIVRGQIAKIVSNAAGLTGNPDPQIFTDVPSSDTFYVWINRLTRQGAMGGYPCGTVPTEPCDGQNRPYFRPYNNATRGQISQIAARAANLTGTPTGQSFTDVPIGSTFYLPIERLYALGVITGYPCGGVNPETGQPEPCDGQGRPYFRPNNRVIRGQASQIVARTFFPQCQVVR